MITSLTVKKVATYDDEGVTFSDLKKVNYFFGFNGSGKSTIAKALRSITNPTSDFQNCAQSGFDPQTHQLLIFDEQYIDTNFNLNENLRGIFSLNEANEAIDRDIREKQETIRDLMTSKEQKNQLKIRIEAEKLKSENEILQYCWTKRSTFSTFTKFNLIYSGSKANHFQKIRSTIDSGLTPARTLEELKHNYDELYENELVDVSVTIDVSLYRDIRRLESKLQPLLGEVIVGNEDVDVAELIRSLDNKRWVEEGQQYVNETKICPFCQESTLTDSLKEQFNHYFDSNYKNKIQSLRSLLMTYRSKTNDFVLNLRALQSVYNPQNIVSNILLELQDLFSNNIISIEDKISSSNERKTISSLISAKSRLSAIIKKINENNLTFTTIDLKRRRFINEVWNYISTDCKTAIERHKVKLQKFIRITITVNNLIDRVDQNIQQERSEIEILRNQTVDTQVAVQNINTILRNSGFSGFQIEERSTVNNISQYYLKRPGTTRNAGIFKSLSEGEKNFISFLYFCEECLGTDDIEQNSRKKKIIVIDDPVSSLDSQALFIVSTLIHKIINRKGNSAAHKREFKNDNLEQVFILTHNLYFYKEVAFDRRPTCNDFWHYNVVKVNNITTVKGDRKKFVHDDYSLLWDTLKAIKSQMPTDNSLNIVVANTMRRILESYVNFIGYGHDSWAALSTVDQASPTFYIKSAFVSLINDESHKASALDGMYYQRIVSQTPDVLFSVFADIFSVIGNEHYLMMMSEHLD